MRDTQPAGRTYTIGELATMSGTTERALRHYEDLGFSRPHAARTAIGAMARRTSSACSRYSCSARAGWGSLIYEDF